MDQCKILSDGVPIGSGTFDTILGGITIWNPWSNESGANLEDSACTVRVLLFFSIELSFDSVGSFKLKEQKSSNLKKDSYWIRKMEKSFSKTIVLKECKKTKLLMVKTRNCSEYVTEFIIKLFWNWNFGFKIRV